MQNLLFWASLHQTALNSLLLALFYFIYIYIQFFSTLEVRGFFFITMKCSDFDEWAISMKKNIPAVLLWPVYWWGKCQTLPFPALVLRGRKEQPIRLHIKYLGNTLCKTGALGACCSWWECACTGTPLQDKIMFMVCKRWPGCSTQWYILCSGLVPSIYLLFPLHHRCD